MSEEQQASFIPTSTKTSMERTLRSGKTKGLVNKDKFTKKVAYLWDKTHPLQHSFADHVDKWQYETLAFARKLIEEVSDG